MRKTQSSMTAVGIAIVRAIESEQPASERICCDPYARRMVNDFLFRFVRFFDRLGYGERKGPGVMGFLAVRERHIDDQLKACLADGLEQLVILGAGFDARAYRFEELKGRVKVFEVDHPASQQIKLKKVEQIFGRAPEYVTYVPIDFNTQTLADRLAQAGYDETCRTLFIWQGVTQYLTPEAVDSTLAFIAHHSGPGSSVIFDYMYPTLLDGTVKRGEVSKMRRDRWMTGESLVFGIPAGTVTAFLEQRGFTQVFDANAKYLHAAYFTGVNQKRTVADGYAIASAVVKGRSQQLKIIR
jgi:methyltransferase (TIGR00027 family)